jgi:hypothetical protein
MSNSRKPYQTFFAVIGALLGWFALIAQFILMLQSRKYSIPFTIVNFFSFFTILTNILTALCFTLLIFKPKFASFLTNPSSLTAVTVYITVVGLVYNLILRSIWDPQGLQMVVDELLHLVIPVLFILFWLVFVPKAGHKWSDVFTWLLYPLLYVIYTLIRGSIMGYYPYPFLDTGEHGFNKVLVNSAILTLVFIGFSSLYTAIAKAMSKRESSVSHHTALNSPPRRKNIKRKKRNAD